MAGPTAPKRAPRRSWPAAEKRRIVELTLRPGASLLAIAREHGPRKSTSTTGRCRFGLPRSGSSRQARQCQRQQVRRKTLRRGRFHQHQPECEESHPGRHLYRRRFGLRDRSCAYGGREVLENSSVRSSSARSAARRPSREGSRSCTLPNAACSHSPRTAWN
jgi:transposase-like protein